MDRRIRPGERIDLWISVLFTVLLSVTIVKGADYLALLLHQLLFPDPSAASTDSEPVYLILLTLAALRVLFTRLEASYALRFAEGIVLRIKMDLLRHWSALPPGVRKGYGSARFSILLEKGAEHLTPYFSAFLPQLYRSVLIPAVYLFAAFGRDALSAWILLLTAPLIPLFIVLINTHVRALTQRQWDTLQGLASVFSDTMHSMLLLKLFDLRDKQGSVLREQSAEFSRRTLEVLKIAFLSAFTLEFVATLSTAVVAVELGLRLLHGSVNFEDAVFLLLLAPEFYLPLRLTGSRFHAAKEASSAMDAVAELLGLNISAPSESSSITGAAPRPADSPQFLNEPLASLELRDLSIELSGTSVRVPGSHVFSIGETVLIRGGSGSGKSTLLDALAAWYAPSGGQILVNGHPLMQLDPVWWRDQLECIPQFPVIFNASLRFNMIFSHDRHSDEQLLSLIADLGLQDRFGQNPRSLDTMLGEGAADLSGGEAQRIAFARALLSRRPVIMLDEFSSMADPDSEKRLLNQLRRLKKDRLIFLVSHRPQTELITDRTLDVHAAAGSLSHGEKG